MCHIAIQPYWCSIVGCENIVSEEELEKVCNKVARNGQNWGACNKVESTKWRLPAKESTTLECPNCEQRRREGMAREEIQISALEHEDRGYGAHWGQR